MLDLCNDMKLPTRGRQSRLAVRFKVSQQAAKKWLDGKGYPTIETVVEIADWADVNVNWLLQGVGPKHGNRIDAKALVIDEAVRSLPPEIGIDLIDNLRAKLERVGKLQAQEPSSRYLTMLDAYENELKRPRH
jgi:transcriptional regulator with XRE-family HTH domain